MTPRALIGGASVDLVDESTALAMIRARIDGPDARPLGVASINLDHIHHLRRDVGFASALETDAVEWLSLIDGAPIAARAQRLTGTAWPRLAGSDLIGPILAAAAGRRLGVLGGTEETHRLLRARLDAAHPSVTIAGTWAPSRAELADPEAAGRIADEIAAAGVDVLLVALGKPRQERWIAQHGARSGARVLLAFGAVVDFLAGRVARAPRPVAAAGMEWAWRLAMEPRRLARRYLVQGPPAYLEVRRSARLVPEHSAQSLATSAAASPASQRTAAPPAGGGRFVTGSDRAEATVVIVTYNSGADIDGLLASLRPEADGVALRVVVADNSSTDDTVDRVAAHDDVTLLRTGGNLGYSAGINAAQRIAPSGEHLLILNPDLVVHAGAVRALLRRLATARAGVVAPAILDADGAPSPTIRREPAVLRALGDAALGAHWPGRPAWLSDMNWRDADYRAAHPVDWASGAALLIRAELAEQLAWEEGFFLYSEETDYQRRARAAGWEVWFEPDAVVLHRQGGSGSSPALTALSEVNRVRYVRRHHGAAYTAAYRGAVILHNALRVARPEARHALATVARGASWRSLPAAVRDPASPDELAAVTGSIVIPAHQEEAVIRRTLDSLGALPTLPAVEVIVVANGCTDATAERARAVEGVRVIEIPTASKPAALNAGDAAATRWPRLYLDGDIAIDPRTVAQLFAALADEDGPLEAARPASRYDTAGAGHLVRAYYRARTRMPSLTGRLWGAGAYALSRAGRARFAEFPALTADDLFVDRAIPDDRVAVLPTHPVVVRVPRTAGALVRMLRRVARGNAEQGGATTTASTVRELAAGIRSPGSAVDAVVYAGFVVVARLAARGVRPDAAWERDDSSRSAEAAP